MQFKRAEWASRKDSIREISAPCGPLTTVYAAASIWEMLHQAQDHRGRKGLAVQRGLSHDRAHEVGRNPLCTEQESPVAPTPALVRPMGNLPEPPRGPSGFRKIWQENHLDTQNKASSSL